MRYIVIMLVLVFIAIQTHVYAGGTIQEQLRDTPEMSERCIKNIGYYQDKIAKYELRVHLNAGQKIKVHYYKSELESWQDYCYGNAEDPDFR